LNTLLPQEAQSKLISLLLLLLLLVSSSKQCFTPRRNPNVEEALTFFASFRAWQTKVRASIINRWNALYSGRSHTKEEQVSKHFSSSLFFPFLYPVVVF
jgi:hypothetical protein